MGEFSPELSDIFSLGLTFLQLVLNLSVDEINGMNNIKTGGAKIQEQIEQINHFGIRLILREMLIIDSKNRVKILKAK